MMTGFKLLHLKFCLQCFRSAEKDQDVQRPADIVLEMEKLDGSQEEVNEEKARCNQLESI